MRNPIVGVPCYTGEMELALGAKISYLNGSYLGALESAGACPLQIPNPSREETLQGLFSCMDGLLLPGGPDLDPADYGEAPIAELGKTDPQRDEIEKMLIALALEQGMPILGICRGMQSLNVACSGSLWQDIAAQVPSALPHRFYPNYPADLLSHTVCLSPGSRLASIFRIEEIPVNSMHHQSIKMVGIGLKAVAHAPDGIIEALEGDGDAWVVAVQFHPEWLWKESSGMRALFNAFAAACTAYQTRRINQ